MSDGGGGGGSGGGTGGSGGGGGGNGGCSDGGDGSDVGDGLLTAGQHNHDWNENYECMKPFLLMCGWYVSTYDVGRSRKVEYVHLLFIVLALWY